jgi:trigger factor
VQDEEVVEIMENLRKARNVGAHVHDDGTVHEHAHGITPTPSQKEGANPEEISLPELNDEFAQSFGDNFKTLEDLKNKIKENLTLEKKAKIQDKERNHILERLVKETKSSLPEILITEELGRMKSQMMGDVERFGGKWDEYLVQIKKTEEDLAKDWRETAEKRILSQLILNEIAKQEKIEASKEEIDVEAIRILSEMPEANENHVNSYVHQMILNEKVMKFLTEIK